MNRILLCCILALLSFSSFGQTDSLFSFFNENEATLIPSPNGGYLSGTNGYNDMEKLQLFFPQRSLSVLGVFCWTGVAANASEDPNSSVVFRIRAFDSTGTSALPFGPAATLDSVIVSLDNLQTGGSFPDNLQFIPFNQPVLVTGPYMAGFSLERIAANSNAFADTFAVYTTAIDSARQIGYSWEKWQGEYRQIIDTWGVNIDFGIFPVIDTTLNTTLNISSSPVNFYPNPAKNEINLQDLPKSGKTTIVIRDLSGRLLLSKEEFIQNDSLRLDISGIQSGQYILLVSNNQDIKAGMLFVR
jgi:hypothetical protein